MTTKDSISFFSAHHSFRGIGFGAARIRALVDRFGSDVFRVLESKDAEAISEAVGDECAARIIVAYTEASAEHAVVAWLSPHGIEPSIAIKACTILGRECRRLIEENPYILVSFLGWKKTDEIARKTGVPLDDRRRSIGATKAILLRGLSLGHTVFPKDSIAREVSLLLGTPSPGIIAAIEQGVATCEGNEIRPAATAFMEKVVAHRLRKLADIEHSIADCTIAQLPAALTSEQREGVAKVLSRSASVLCGGAGTGKTTTLLALIQAAETEGWKCIMIAPTGKAAARMRATTLRPARTIAAFLHALEKEPLFGKVMLIVDEASMVALPEAYKLLAALPETGSIVMVGDDGQLPPVGFGVIFHVLAGSETFPRAMLTRIMRQTETSGIPKTSRSIRTGEIPEWNRYAGPGDGVSLLETNDPIAAAIEAYFELDGAQVLAPTKAAVQQINIELQRRHRGAVIHQLESFGFRKGDPICCTKNDYHLGVWNGSLGHVIGAESKEFGLGLVVIIDGEEKMLPLRYLANVELAYAITGHRSQGSSFPRVIVVINGASMVDRAWAYTCITRAEAQAVVVGRPGDINAAIRGGNAVSRRRVGFAI